MNRAVGKLVRSAAAAAVVLLAAAPAQAQDKKVTVNFGAGAIFPAGEVADQFDIGFAIPVGVTFKVNTKVGIQVEYLGGFMNGPSALINGDILKGGAEKILIESNHSVHAGTVNLVLNFQGSGGIGGRITGGTGFYRRQVELTTPSASFAWITVCNPYWFYCGDIAAPVISDDVLGRRSTTDIGFNIGGSVNFGPVYVEVRYHWVNGPEFKVPNQPVAGTTAKKAIGHYVPVIVGFRF